ncbi:MAG: efflux RND transporter periplasmic adaptor subunit [Elusimicrobia bacterium]|nr:efflux RND transporter periplasmic adaptor subunit [Elusimicrobiota bacterium]
MKTKIAIVAAVAAIAAGCWFWFSAGKSKGRGRGERGVTVKEGAIEQTVEATGSVVPMNRVEIKPPIQGRIEELVVQEGTPVKQGQVLAWMSSSDRAAILDAARAKGPEELKKWEDSYKPTPIVSPLSGVVILRNVVVGQTVEQSTILYAMSDKLIVVAQVDESDIGKIKMAMPAKITLDSFPDRNVKGTVFDILYEGKNVSNVIQYPVKIKLESAPDWFRSQMTANISFIIRRKEDALLLPTTAVLDAPGGVKQVFVPGPDGKPTKKEIKLGIESGELVEVVEGLSEGDKVLLAQTKYVPQQAAQSSPLNVGGRPGDSRQGGGSGGRRRGGGGN